MTHMHNDYKKGFRESEALFVIMQILEFARFY